MRKPAYIEPLANTPERRRPDKFDRIVIRGKNCRLKTVDRMGFGFVTEDDPFEEFQFTVEDYAAARRSGVIDLKRGYHNEGQARVRAALRGKSLDDIAKPKISKAKYREKLIQMYLQEDVQARIHGRRLFRSDEHLADLLAKWHRQIVSSFQLEKPVRKPRVGTPTGDTEPPLVRTFNNWFREYMQCGMDYAGLIDRYWGTASKAAKACPRSYRLWVIYADRYLDRLKPKRADLFRRLTAAIALFNERRASRGETLLLVPPESFFNDLIDRHGEYAIMYAREGAEKARRRFEPIHRKFRHYRPGERVELDFWYCDLFVFLKKTGLLWHLSVEDRKKLPNQRMLFCAALDVASRSILALAASSTATSAAVLEVLQMIGRDKSEMAQLAGAKTPWDLCCTPEKIVFDNGSEFANNAVHEALGRMRTTATHPPAADPARRPFIESWFRTFGRYMLPYFDGRTFSNPLEKGDRDPQMDITLTAEELAKVAVRVVCDIYHNAPHEGLAGNSPYNAWKELSQDHEPHEPPTQHEVCMIFGTEHERTVTPEGVNFMGIPYTCDKLQNLLRTSPGGKAGITARIRVNRRNLESIVFYLNGDWLPAHNSIDLENAIEDGPPVTYDEWLDAMRTLKKRNELKIAGGLMPMYTAIEDLRRLGDETRARAMLSPSTVSVEEIEQNQKSFVGSAWFSKSQWDENDGHPVEEDTTFALMEGGAVRGDREGGDTVYEAAVRAATSGKKVKANRGAKKVKRSAKIEAEAIGDPSTSVLSSFSGRNPNDF